MRTYLASTLTALAVYAVASQPAFACCGSCDHDAHDGDHHHAAPAAKEAAMDTAAAGTSSFDGTAAPEQVTLEPTRFAIYKGTLSNPAAVWEVAPGLAAAQSLLGADTHVWSIVPDMPDTANPEEMDPNLPYWAGFTIGADAQPSGELEAYTTPGGKYVRAVHRGAYQNLGSTWEKFAGYVVTRGQYDASRPMLEHYVSDPGSTPEADLITHLYIPVK